MPMQTVLWLLFVLGLIGAFDTFYYHEWRARLPARGRAAGAELKLHAARDFFYAVIFGTLPWVEWRGGWALVFLGVIIAEIALTMADFIVEADERKPLGDVYPGERVTHNFMGIIFGGMCAFLLPVLWQWWQQPAGFSAVDYPVPAAVRWMLGAMAAGVFLSGCRDLYAALELPGGHWPWPKIKTDEH